MKNRDMENEINSGLPAGPHEGFFEIRVKGQLDESWSDWLAGLEIKLVNEEEMILSGYIRDQAALMGILSKLYNLNFTLISVSSIAGKK
jgi:hypothetical protein